MISSETTYQPPQLNNQAITRSDIIRYTKRHCDSFAIALHLLYKNPIYAIMQVFPDDFGELDENNHPH